MGTLVAFTVVSIGVIILRRTQPDLPRGFRVLAYPVTPILSAGFRLYIISQLPYSTFALFAVWLGVAALIYFTYSARHSRLARGRRSPRRTRMNYLVGLTADRGEGMRSPWAGCWPAPAT